MASPIEHVPEEESLSSESDHSFSCNLCGAICAVTERDADRERSSCNECSSTMRQRGLAALLSQELLGVALSLSELPGLKDVCGLGLSDPEGLAEKLAAKFDYTNTYYHREPALDIQNPGAEHKGRYDFIICSEVMEHVPGPLEAAFSNLYTLLKPDAFLLLTVPYRLGDGIDEHFPDLNEYSLAEVGDETVLLNRTRQGELQVHRDLCFHGGGGSTLELRLFSESALLAMLEDAGFEDIEVCTAGFSEFGVRFAEQWSLPIVARKGKFRLPANETLPILQKLAQKVRNLESELVERETTLERELQSTRTNYEKFVEFHESSQADLERQLEERERWVRKVEEDFEMRSLELKELDKKKNAALADMHQALTSNAQAWEKVAQLERELSRPVLKITRVLRRMGRRAARLFHRN